MLASAVNIMEFKMYYAHVIAGKKSYAKTKCTDIILTKCSHQKTYSQVVTLKKLSSDRRKIVKICQNRETVEKTAWYRKQPERLL